MSYVNSNIMIYVHTGNMMGTLFAQLNRENATRIGKERNVCKILEKTQKATTFKTVNEIQLLKEVEVKQSLCFNRTPRPEGIMSGGIAPRIPDLGTRCR
jgi:hypothetical protein